MKTELLKVALRNKALFIPTDWKLNTGNIKINETTSVLLANSSKLGFTFSEELLHALNDMNPKYQSTIYHFLKEVSGAHKNWTPLVKQWDIPTGESVMDHVITFFANLFQSKNGTRLACGHIIPRNTFPIERYNGCPYCGTPFHVEELELPTYPSKLKVLELWNEDNLHAYLNDLLTSPVALEASQVDSLKILLSAIELDLSVEIQMKETVMLVIDELVQLGKAEKAGKLFKSANDILRYLWYKHTGFLQLVEPKVIAKRIEQNTKNMHFQLDKSHTSKLNALAELKLKYTRAECKMYATWLNSISGNASLQCEIMHPKRGMWVRVIRALRLAEYSKAKGFENLARLLDLFYNEKYEVWSGRINQFKLKMDAENTFLLLKQRPGLFARSLFSTMLWFGPELTLKHFREVINEVPKRLIFTLNMYAEIYFDKNASRTVKPLGGVGKKIKPNQLLCLFTNEELNAMKLLIQDLSLAVIKEGLMRVKNPNKTIFIHPDLDRIPIAIGDRSESIQDLPNALTGTRFSVEGSKVRLFLQWGVGLPAQHLDMDLSCSVAYPTGNEHCSYSQLEIPGCKHSGDIQRIPSKVGTAEYIELDLDELTTEGAKYVTFTCNAYTNGSLTPNLVVGWMNSAFPMKITSNGVAYDPTAVQHQVRIQQQLTKGLVFGVLDVEKREIIWLEMSFGGQIVQNLSTSAVESLIHKLDAKLKIGDLLKLKAEVQQLTCVADPTEADEVYDVNWALNTAAVSKLFLE